MCVDVSEWPQKGEFVVFNPRTGKTILLPRLHYPRNPAIITMSENLERGSFQVVVVGAIGRRDLASEVEVFNSGTSEWDVKRQLPAELGLEGKRAAVSVNGTLYFIVQNHFSDRVASYDVQSGKLDWYSFVPPRGLLSVIQLFEIEGLVSLFVVSPLKGYRVRHRIYYRDVDDQKCKERVVMRWRILRGVVL